jgi:hypothetical protein
MTSRDAYFLALLTLMRKKFRSHCNRNRVSSDQIVTLTGRGMIGLITIVQDPNRSTVVIALPEECGSGWEPR